MRSLSWTEPCRRKITAILSFLCLNCSTTLDPTTLVENSSDPPTNNPDDEVSPGCSPSGPGGATFTSCAELPECSKVGSGGRYLLCNHPLTYEAAAHECELRGGYLAEITTSDENTSIATAAQQVVGTNVWLGATRSATFEWTWQRSGTLFWQGERNGAPVSDGFVIWQPGEPNNTSTVSDEPEKCLALTMGDADWNDRACSLKLPFACEID